MLSQQETAGGPFSPGWAGRLLSHWVLVHFIKKGPLEGVESHPLGPDPACPPDLVVRSQTDPFSSGKPL